MIARQNDPRSNTTIIFVRHTDVENPEEVFYGRIPGYGLSVLGQEQALRTASVLASEKLDAVYSSPMLRARQTARLIADPHNLKPQITWLLAEVRTAWQGRKFTELDEIGFDFYSRPLHPRDETLQELWERIERFGRQVRDEHPGQTVAALTHGDVCMTARAGFLGLPIDVASIRLPHVYAGKGSLTRVTFGPDPEETYPLSVEYHDPNGEESRWTGGWVLLDAQGALHE